MTRDLGGARSLPIDILKVVASQLIVLHHLALYGPMSEHAAPLWPALFDWLETHARVVVQVFLVVGGLLAGQRLLPGQASASASLLPQLLDRYLRLALPLVAALLLAIGAATLARLTMSDDWIPAAPSAGQLLLHLLLLQDLAGVDALSAGVWYVAIAFQLHALLLLIVALAPNGGTTTLVRRGSTGAASLPWLLAGAVGLSAWWFNRQPSWDVAAPYFLAAYGLGVLVAWRELGRSARLACTSAMLVVAAALVIDWRDRLGLALAVAAGLWCWQVLLERRSRRPLGRSDQVGGPLSAAIATLSRSSFALFLLHFPVALLVNALFARFVPASPWPQAVGLLTAWLVSVAAGELFFRRIEQPLMRFINRRRARPGRAVTAEL